MPTQSSTRAIAEHRARQAEYDAAARNLTAAETTLSLARQQCDPDEVARLRARLAEFVDVPTCTVPEASTALDAAKVREATAVTMANGLRARLDEMQPRVLRVVADLGGDIVLARQNAQRRLDEVASELAGLDSSIEAGSASEATALETAARGQADLERLLADATATLEAATSTRSNAEAEVATLETEAAALRGQLTAINRPALE